MSRAPTLALLAPAALVAAAERILADPTRARASLDEVYTFAVATTQLAEIAGLTARHLGGEASDADLDRLRTHLRALGVLPAACTPPDRQEPDDGQG